MDSPQFPNDDAIRANGAHHRIALTEEQIREAVEDITAPFERKRSSPCLVEGVAYGTLITAGILGGTSFFLVLFISFDPLYLFNSLGLGSGQSPLRFDGRRVVTDPAEFLGFWSLLIGVVVGVCFYLYSAWARHWFLRILPEDDPNEPELDKSLRFGWAGGLAGAFVTGFIGSMISDTEARGVFLPLFILAACAVGFVPGWALGQAAHQIRKWVTHLDRDQPELS